MAGDAEPYDGGVKFGTELRRGGEIVGRRGRPTEQKNAASP